MELHLGLQFYFIPLYKYLLHVHHSSTSEKISLSLYQFQSSVVYTRMHIATLASSWQGSLCHYHIWITHNHWPVNIKGIHVHNCHGLYPTLRQHTVSSTPKEKWEMGWLGPTNRFQEGFGVHAECIPCMFTMYLMHVLMYKGHIYNACTYVGASICTPVILSEPNKGFHCSCIYIYISYNATAKKLAWLLDLHNGLSWQNYNSIQSHKPLIIQISSEWNTHCTVWCWLSHPLIWSRGGLTTFSTRMWLGWLKYSNRHQ